MHFMSKIATLRNLTQFLFVIIIKYDNPEKLQKYWKNMKINNMLLTGLISFCFATSIMVGMETPQRSLGAVIINKTRMIACTAKPADIQRRISNSLRASRASIGLTDQETSTVAPLLDDVDSNLKRTFLSNYFICEGDVMNKISYDRSRARAIARQG